jgi:O-antigen/teichoic acid export membrane protein
VRRSKLDGGDAPKDAATTAPRSSLFASAVMTYATNLATATLSLVNVIIVARALGATGRGDVAFLITVATVTGQLASLSIQEANGNIAGTNPDQRARLATNSLLLSLLLGAVAGVIVAGAVAVVPRMGGEVARPLLWMTLGSLPFVIVRLYLSYLVQADYAFAASNLAWLSGPMTTALANGVLALFGVLSVTAAITAWIVGQALGAAILVVYVARHAGFGRPDPASARRALTFGAKAHVSRLMSVGNYRVDQWFVGAMSGSRQLGIYSVAVAWAEMLYYLPGVLVLVQRPDLVRAPHRHAAAVASRMLRAALILATIFAGLLLVAAPLLCVTIFGEEFRGAVGQLRILAFAAFGISALELLTGALIAQRRPLQATIAVLVAFLPTIALDLLLIPDHAGSGAALARVLAYTAGGAAAALIFTRTFDGRLRDLIPRSSDLMWLVNKVRSTMRRASPDVPVVPPA